MVRQMIQTIIYDFVEKKKRLKFCFNKKVEISVIDRENSDLVMLEFDDFANMLHNYDKTYMERIGQFFINNVGEHVVIGIGDNQLVAKEQELHSILDQIKFVAMRRILEKSVNE